eukprot:g49837.t1
MKLLKGRDTSEKGKFVVCRGKNTGLSEVAIRPRKGSCVAALYVTAKTLELPGLSGAFTTCSFVSVTRAVTVSLFQKDHRSSPSMSSIGYSGGMDNDNELLEPGMDLSQPGFGVDSSTRLIQQPGFIASESRESLSVGSKSASKQEMDKVIEDHVSKSKCVQCDKPDPGFFCEGCEQVEYCGEACQVTHWKQHRNTCKPRLQQQQQQQKPKKEGGEIEMQGENERTEAVISDLVKATMALKLEMKKKRASMPPSSAYDMAISGGTSIPLFITHADKDNEEDVIPRATSSPNVLPAEVSGTNISPPKSRSARVSPEKSRLLNVISGSPRISPRTSIRSLLTPNKSHPSPRNSTPPKDGILASPRMPTLLSKTRIVSSPRASIKGGIFFPSSPRRDSPQKGENRASGDGKRKTAPPTPPEPKIIRNGMGAAAADPHSDLRWGKEDSTPVGLL